jgi:hypothetical protein
VSFSRVNDNVVVCRLLELIGGTGIGLSISITMVYPGRPSFGATITTSSTSFSASWVLILSTTDLRLTPIYGLQYELAPSAASHDQEVPVENIWGRSYSWGRHSNPVVKFNIESNT